ncbi:MAG: cell division protein FtsQ/DivIB [Lachnospiraceae bacterium]|nr:cell division protein FtsQ/DivIB [Lachnospiraceae bacterium]
MSYYRNHKSIFIITGILTVLLIAIIVAVVYVLQNYKITTVYVEGNVHYTNEEVMGMVMEGPLSNNSLVLSIKYKNKKIKDIPFVSAMDISVQDPHTVKIDVYEKAVAGYVEYLEKFMYFDKDGIIVEAADEKTKGIPLVTGLSFEHVVLYEPLPVEDPNVFESILTITQLVNKYNLSIDRIYFGRDKSITLFFDDIRVSLGEAKELDEKIMKLQYMLPEIEGKSGELRMENYTEETKSVSFEPDNN